MQIACVRNISPLKLFLRLIRRHSELGYVSTRVPLDRERVNLVTRQQLVSGLLTSLRRIEGLSSA